MMFRLFTGRGAVGTSLTSARRTMMTYTPPDFSDLKIAGEHEAVPREAAVVICGGGVVGAAVAYHLAEMGWGERTVLLEQAKIGGAPTWSSSGLVGVFKPTLAQVRLCQTSMDLIHQLEDQGLSTGWKQCGSLCLARTNDRMTVFRRMKALSVSWNIDCKLLTPIEAKDLCPLIRIDDLKGALWIPGDGVGDPYMLCHSLLKSAIAKGVRVYETCSVGTVHSDSGSVKSVESSRGIVQCKAFVNCAGFWARQLGMKSNPPVKIPLHPVEHYYLRTKPAPIIDPLMPVVRDQDGHIYFREHEGYIIAGGFEPIAKPAFEDGNTPRTQAERQLPEDWDHFHVLLQQLLHRIPALGNCVVKKLTNAPEAFSPDCKWIVGEAPEIEGYYVAAGMKTVGVAASGGVGKAIAELITKKKTSFDMYEIDISRFLGLHNNSKFLRERVSEVPGLHYSVMYPMHEFQTGRNLRMSPIYPKLKEAGAVFGQVMGYERPTWFQPTDNYEGGTPYRIAATNTFGKPPWFDYVASEYEACRESVGLSDYSSFTKLEMWSAGNEVVKSLQYLCSNDVDVPIGSIIHTGMQNEAGGYENDCSLVRLAPNHYMIIAPTIQQTRCKRWIQKHLPKDGSVSLADVTSMYTAICLMGPLSRSLLAELTDQDISPKYFPFFTYKKVKINMESKFNLSLVTVLEHKGVQGTVTRSVRRTFEQEASPQSRFLSIKDMDVGFATSVRVMNLTHTGELGYVLYIPNEFALHVYNKIIEAGDTYGVKHVGYYAMRALRVEKFYAFWGQDLDTTTTPLECGRTWRVKFDKGEFIGREELLKQREEGVNRMYVQLLLMNHDEDADFWSWGGEPIYRDGKYSGATTTTGYGFTFKQQVCLGFIQNFDNNGKPHKVTNEYVLSGNYEVDIGGRLYEAKVHLHSPNLPSKYPDKEREAYHATRDKMVNEPILRVLP